ncbi:MAG: hypothetical protein GY909_09330 [Oligoflexia bacterium]|nr:hypothetical protein [Oligoflexia bacterium]
MNKIGPEGLSHTEKSSASIYYNPENRRIYVSQYPVSIELGGVEDMTTLLSQGEFSATDENDFPSEGVTGEALEIQRALINLASVNLATQGLAMEVGGPISSCHQEVPPPASQAETLTTTPCESVPPVTSQVDFCSRSNRQLKAMSCLKRNFNLRDVPADFSKQTHFDLFAFRLEEGLVKNTILPCVSCQDKSNCSACQRDLSSRQRKKIYKKLLNREPVEIPGYESIEDFYSENRNEINEYLNRRARSYRDYLSARRQDRAFRNRRREWGRDSQEVLTHLNGLKLQIETSGPVTQQLLTSRIMTAQSHPIKVHNVERNGDLEIELGTGERTVIEYDRTKNKYIFNGEEVMVADPLETDNRGKRMFGRYLSDNSFSEERNEYCEPLIAFTEGNARRLRDVWGTENEGFWERLFKYPFRLVYHTVDRTVGGRTVGAVGDLARGQYQDSIVNPLMTAHNITMDVGHLATAPIDAAFPSTNRIELCTSNLIYNFMRGSEFTSGERALAALNPTLHVGVVIDDQYETRDALMEGSSGTLRNAEIEADLDCVDLSIRSNEPESVVLERLRCLNETFGGAMGWDDYSLFGYNCGGYTRDILEAAGLSMPIGINFGVGSVFRSRSDEMDRHLETSVEYCENHLRLSRLMINALENESLTDQLLESFEHSVLNPPKGTGHGGLYSPSPDLLLQLMISSARSDNNEDLNRVQSLLESIMTRSYSRGGDDEDTYRFDRGLDFFRFYLQPSDEAEGGYTVKRKYKATLRDMFGDINPEEVARLSRFPGAQEVLLALQESP